jgi:general secretion pathway protein N
MARVPIRSTAPVMAVAAVFAAQTASLGEPQSNRGSIDGIESESAKQHESDEAPAGAGSLPLQPSTIGNPLWAIPVSKLSASRDHPLFSPSRRPRPPAVAVAPAPPAAAAKPVALELPPFTLVGTIIGGDRRIAIFFEETSKTATGVRQGEGFSGWILRSVASHSAVLEGGGRTVTLDLPQPVAPEAPRPAFP